MIQPDVDVMFVGTLMWSADTTAVSDVLALVRNDDIESPALATVLGAVRRLVGAGKPHEPTLVLDELRRTGELNSVVAEKLRSATTCGASGLSVRSYGAAVVAPSLRRRIAAAGEAFTTIAQGSPEADLEPLVERATSSVQSCADRLAKLRGCADE